MNAPFRITSIESFLNDGIKNIQKNVLRFSSLGNRERLFIKQYIQTSRRALKIRRELSKKGEHIPPFLIASITRRCNLCCSGCYAKANQAKAAASGSSELSTEKWAAIFTEAQSLGVEFILLAGGEPLIRRDVLTAVGGIKNIVFPVFTNGTLFDDAYIRLFDEHRNVLPVFSVEGGEAATDLRRGGGVYNLFIKNIHTLKERGILFGASITVTSENINEVTHNDFVGDLHQNGCNVFFFVEYVECNTSENMRPLDNGQREYLARRIFHLQNVYTNILCISFPGDEKAMDGCLAAGRGFFHINPSGGVEPCPFSPYSDTSLTTAGLREALRSPLFSKIQASALLNEKHSGACVLAEKDAVVASLLEDAD
ncbi:MAG: radical SAM protein [Spirochaetaceae bacterium]|jgi:MoaA/NifB/PqqE/SkfB family radical SAM enzyme|nr:radical SAM protein [Spirochaetaceae bacterium]